MTKQDLQTAVEGIIASPGWIDTIQQHARYKSAGELPESLQGEPWQSVVTAILPPDDPDQLSRYMRQVQADVADALLRNAGGRIIYCDPDCTFRVVAGTPDHTLPTLPSTVGGVVDHLILVTRYLVVGNYYTIAGQLKPQAEK